MKLRKTTLQSANQVFPKILHSKSGSSILTELPGSISTDEVLIELDEEFPIGIHYFSITTMYGSIVIRAETEEGAPTTITVYDTWASHGGSYIDGSRRYNGAMDMFNPATISESFYALPEFVSYGFNWMTPVDFGTYFVIHSAGANREPVKIAKTLDSHEYIAGIPANTIIPQTYPLVNREIGGVITLAWGTDPDYFKQIMYIDMDTGSIDTFEILSVSPSEPANNTEYNQTHFVYLGNRKFLFYPQYDVTQLNTAYIFEITQAGAISYIETKDWTGVIEGPFWGGMWTVEPQVMRRDNAVYISGFTYTGGVGQNEQRHTMMKIDWDGNFIWRNEYLPDMSSSGNVYPQPFGFLSNGNIVYVYSSGIGSNYFVVEIDSTTGAFVDSYDTGITWASAPPAKLVMVNNLDEIFIKDYNVIFKYRYQQSDTIEVIGSVASDGYLHSATMSETVDQNYNIAMVSRNTADGDGISIISPSGYIYNHNSAYDFSIWFGGPAIADGKIYVVADSGLASGLAEFTVTQA